MRHSRYFLAFTLYTLHSTLSTRQNICRCGAGTDPFNSKNPRIPWRDYPWSHWLSSWHWVWLQYSLPFVRMCSRERNPLREFCSPPFFLYPRAHEALGWLLRIIFLFCPLMQCAAFFRAKTKMCSSIFIYFCSEAYFCIKKSPEIDTNWQPNWHSLS